MRGNLDLLRSLVAMDGDAVREALLDPDADLAGFFRFVHQHQLGAFSYVSMKQLGLIERLPTPVLRAAKAACLLERAPTERALALLRDLGPLFDSAGVRVMFLKGPLLAKRYYASLDARNVADLDVLIREPGDLTKVEAVLLQAGFEPAFRVPLSRTLAHIFAHHFEYRRGGVPLDVHWALQRHFSFNIDYDRVWATAAHVDLDGHKFLAASDEYEIVLQVLGVITDLQVGKLTIRPIVDLIRMLTTVGDSIDWPRFLAARERERILRPTVYVLKLALDVMERHSQFADLCTAIAPTLRELPPTALAHRALLASQPLDVRQKLLALRIYDAPLIASLGWWLVSLPVRMTVYGVMQR